MIKTSNRKSKGRLQREERKNKGYKVVEGSVRTRIAEVVNNLGGPMWLKTWTEDGVMYGTYKTAGTWERA